MKGDSPSLLQPGSADLTSVLAGGSRILTVAVAFLAVLTAIFHETLWSMVQIWERSETFAHGFLIAPIAAYLIWDKRAQLRATPAAPEYKGLLLLAALGFGWMVANVAGVLVVEQLAVVAMIPAGLLTLFGRRFVYVIVFPLAFLVLAVPMGEDLIPPLMNLTADFTVGLLRLTGIPVYREGTFFTIPSGNWSVVEGCSGLRYLIASVVGGVLYAHLTYRTMRKRAVFVLASILVPILANSLRAYMIVMIAHLSDMRLALGIDHLIYGWLFFGVVILLMFWVGSFWRDPPAPHVLYAGGVGAPRALPIGAVMLALGATIITMGVWPVYASHLVAAGADAPAATVAPPPGAAGWQAVAEEVTDWRPRYLGADASFFQAYRKNGNTVALYLGYYHHQRQGAELINSQNVMVPQKDPVWEDVGAVSQSVRANEHDISLRETQIRSRSQRLLVWDWFLIGEHHLSKPHMAKLLLARDRLLGRGDDAFAVILATPYEEPGETARDVLRAFTRDMLPAIESAVRASEQGR